MENKVLLTVSNLKKHIPITKGIFRKVIGQIKAVDGVNFSIKEGETVGLVGESGCGKTTTARCLNRLIETTSGSIEYNIDNKIYDITKENKKNVKKIRRDIQMIFQDPFSSLDPRMTVKNIVLEPLRAFGLGNKIEQKNKVIEVLEKVGIKSYQIDRFPHEFSGGQRQRIGIARALVLNPKLIICDEPVSALDVSVQAQVINLLISLKKEFNLTLLFIAHDLSVVDHISDRVMVMYLGKIVEIANSEKIYSNPQHPYTETLLSSIPIADPRLEKEKKTISFLGEIPDVSNLPSGCCFHTRCSYSKKICSETDPCIKESESDKNHLAACHFSSELSLSGFKT